ncbi:nuclear transport factor 2 family protein [Pseudopedobacter sp.]|uniref:nuclear transport factor 2 family protein n=1 Tax=Pseudopedobacter sp. TaxID=1936787 RepID=UPI00333FF219
MEHQKDKKIIENYVESYNNFDVKGMIKDLDENVVFENITNGKVDLRLNGKDMFEQQAEAAKQYFRTRNQKIESWRFDEFSTIIDIHYSAVVATDLPNGLKSGDTLELRGKSEFAIEAGKIKSIRDYNSK